MPLGCLFSNQLGVQPSRCLSCCGFLHVRVCASSLLCDLILVGDANLKLLCGFRQSGCCKPPTVCGFTFVTATEWDKPANSSSTDSDCNAWNNTSTELCFECNSCRAGVLQNVKFNWRRVAVVNIIVLVFLIVVYSFGCCAFRNARKQGQYKYGQA